MTVLTIERPHRIKTLWGNANFNKNNGYYKLTGNKGLLHRWIFERYFGPIPEGYVIHHKDGNKLNNCIFNLQLMKDSDHKSFHLKGDKHPWFGKTGKDHPCYGLHRSIEQRRKISERMRGENNHFYGKKHSEESRRKMSQFQRNRKRPKHSEETMKKLCEIRNSTGYYRVHKTKNKLYSQGFTWRYSYYENGKRKHISRVNLEDLKKEVQNRGLLWGTIKEKGANNENHL